MDNNLVPGIKKSTLYIQAVFLFGGHVVGTLRV